MFELSIVKKYLVPKKRQLSVSLISLMSIAVISLVVWLLLIFMSVTEGIEHTWLKKLTTLNSPIRITPTENYYNSYYYKIDAISSLSGYTSKSIGEKIAMQTANPHDAEEDEAVPHYFPKPLLDSNGEHIDLAREVFNAIEEIKEKAPELTATDYEITGGLLKLALQRPEMGDTQAFLTQVSYLSSFPKQIKAFEEMLLKPSSEDISHLLYLHPKKAGAIFSHIDTHSFTPSVDLVPPSLQLFHTGKEITAFATLEGGEVTKIVIPKKKGTRTPDGMEKITLKAERRVLKTSYPIRHHCPIFFDSPLIYQATKEGEALRGHAEVQGISFTEVYPIQSVKLVDFKVHKDFQKEPSIAPYWVYHLKDTKKQLLANQIPKSASGHRGILVAKNLKDSGVKLGDTGHISYQSVALSSVQEQQIPVVVTGFYDPGVMSVGARYIMLDPEVVTDISHSTNSMSLDPMMAGGIGVWFDDLKRTKEFASVLQKSLERRGVASYWKVTTFDQFDFARDLLGQFQSDRYLFTLVGLIILAVACTNIISQLLLLVNDKKKEIGILLSMGASKRSVALIFGTCGATLGILSCFIGVLFAFVTLANLEHLLGFLSLIQGRETFSKLLFGNALSGEMSHQALIAVVLATPIIPFFVGPIPAIKACRVNPSITLRAE